MAEIDPQFGMAREGVPVIDRPGAYVVLHNTEGEVALVRSRGDYHLPGGGMDPGETALQAARREVSEEIGLEFELDGEIGRAGQYGFSESEGRQYNKLCTYFLGHLVTGRGPAADCEHSPIWMSVAEAEQCLAHESHGWAVRKAGAGLAPGGPTLL